MAEVLVNIKVSGTEKIPELDKSLEKVTKSSNKVTNAFTDMRKEVRQAKADMLTFAEGTEQYNSAMQKAAANADKMRDMTDKVKASQKDVGVVAKNVSGAVSGMAGAFSTAQGVIALFGIENENTAKAILKIQSTMAITSGIAQFADSIDNMKDLYNGLKINIMAMLVAKQKDTVASVANAVANTAEATAVTAVGTATKITAATITKALGPYALIAAAIGLVVVGLIDLIKKVNEVPADVKLKIEMDESSIRKTQDVREKILKWQDDYKKALETNNTKQLSYLETVAQKEFNISDERLKAIKRTKGGWDAFFKAYLKMVEDTAYNEAIIKKKVELQVAREIALAQQNAADVEYQGLKKRRDSGGRLTLAEYYRMDKLLETHRQINGELAENIKQQKVINSITPRVTDSYFNIEPPAPAPGGGGGKERKPTTSGYKKLKPGAITLPSGFVPSSGAGTTPTPETTAAMNVGASQVVTEGEGTLDMIDRLAGKANEYLSQLGGTFGAIAQLYEANMNVTDAFYDNEAARINASITDNDAREKALQANEVARYEALKKDFEKQKLARIAMAVIDGAAGVVGAISSAAPLGPVGWVLGGLQAAAIIATTIANVNAISKEKLNAPSKAAATNTTTNTQSTVVGPTVLNPNQSSMTSSTENLNMMNKSTYSGVVFVSDINEVQKSVSVRESTSSY